MGTVEQGAPECRRWWCACRRRAASTAAPHGLVYQEELMQPLLEAPRPRPWSVAERAAQPATRVSSWHCLGPAAGGMDSPMSTQMDDLAWPPKITAQNDCPPLNSRYGDSADSDHAERHLVPHSWVDGLRRIPMSSHDDFREPNFLTDRPAPNLESRIPRRGHT